MVGTSQCSRERSRARALSIQGSGRGSIRRRKETGCARSVGSADSTHDLLPQLDGCGARTPHRVAERRHGQSGWSPVRPAVRTRWHRSRDAQSTCVATHTVKPHLHDLRPCCIRRGCAPCGTRVRRRRTCTTFVPAACVIANAETTARRCRCSAFTKRRGDDDFAWRVTAENIRVVMRSREHAPADGLLATVGDSASSSCDHDQVRSRNNRY